MSSWIFILCMSSLLERERSLIKPLSLFHSSVLIFINGVLSLTLYIYLRNCWQHTISIWLMLRVNR